jgi:hypothetical protein
VKVPAIKKQSLVTVFVGSECGMRDYEATTSFSAARFFKSTAQRLPAGAVVPQSVAVVDNALAPVRAAFRVL